MSDPTSLTDTFSKFVPGFEFLQGLVKNAGQTLPSIGQWVAPTLDPEELDRRINELRTVQFWLDQNARMIGTTVQALEVQRMTLGTLKTMNVQMGDLGEALKMRSMADVFQSAPPAPAQAETPAPAPEPAPEPAADAGASAAVDPMQWWGALTQQFTQLATQAMQATSDATTEAQARAAEALKATVTTATETVAPPKKTAARKAAPKPAVPAPAPAPAPKAAPARKAPARKSAKG
ncbi:PhaM family polyhydroxyalkanoate granule multifunctional regulatory protein [Sphaerotilus sp.]|uniref:PhaM family polyhydroxyalkanoate granule multifunctional regulatory protein n=1 Tax=Sphaerotilus sp. TaxID=2093942 RepID=UPI0034E2C22E